MKFRTPWQGFTLLELLVSLSLIAALTLLSTPWLSDRLERMQLRNSAQDIRHTLRLARQVAMQQGREEQVLFDLEARHMSHRSSTTALQPDDVQLQLTTATTETSAAQLGGIRFFPDGSSTGGRIELSLERIHYQVDVDWLTGKVSLR